MSKEIKEDFIQAFEKIATDYENETHLGSSCILCFMTGRWTDNGRTTKEGNCFNCPEILFINKKNYRPHFTNLPCRQHGVDVRHGGGKEQRARGLYLREVIIPKLKTTHANSKCFQVNHLRKK